MLATLQDSTSHKEIEGQNNKPFSAEEFRSRVAKVQARIREENFVGLMVHSPANIYYLSGYHTSAYFSYQVLFVPARGEPVLLVRELERSNADEYSWLRREQQAIYTDVEDPIAVTVRWLGELGWLSGASAIGVEKAESALTVLQFERLREKAGNINLADGSGIVNRVRLIKSEQEIAYIRRAAEITDAGLAAGLEALEVGRTENDVAAAIHEAQVRLGCEYTSLPHYLSSGRRRFLGHATPSDKKLENGDIVRFEITACVKRYSAAVMRTAVMGKPGDDVLRASNLLLESQEMAFRLMRPGAVAGEIDAAVRQPVLDARLRETYTSRIGYSLGIGFPPVSGEWTTRDFMAGDSWILEPGMVFHMLVVAQGISFSDTMLVTPSGAERLGSLDRRLTIVQ